MSKEIFNNIGYKEISLRNKIIKCGWKHNANIPKVNKVLKKYNLKALDAGEMLAYIAQDEIEYMIINSLYPELSDFGLSEEKIESVNSSNSLLWRSFVFCPSMAIYAELMQTDYPDIIFLFQMLMFTVFTLCLCYWIQNKDNRKFLKMYKKVNLEYQKQEEIVQNAIREREFRQARMRERQRELRRQEILRQQKIEEERRIRLERKRQEILRQQRIEEEQRIRLEQKRQEILRQQRIEEERKNQKRNRDFWYNLNPYVFEEKIGELFKDLGYNVIITSKSRDGGVDLVIQKGNEIKAVQCKRYKGKVREPEVRDLWGAKDYIRTPQKIIKATGAIMIALSGVTDEAMDFIKHFPEYELFTIDDILKCTNQVCYKYQNVNNISQKLDKIQNNSKVINLDIYKKNKTVSEVHVYANGEYVIYS